MSLEATALAERVSSVIERNALIPPRGRVVVGVSGGADSMALLKILADLRYEPIVVHVNYGLRGEASDGDERFVRRFCESRGLPVFIHRTDLRRSSGDESIQMAARRIRYREFARVASAHEVGVVAVAHHADDQVETVLLNLFRGTGPEGLAGMPRRRRLEEGIELVRPLLDERKGTLESYLQSTGVSWRADASNETESYRRGFIRNRLLPMVQEEFGHDATSRLLRAAGLTREYVDATLRPEIERRFEECRGVEQRTLDLTRIRSEPPVMQRRLLLEALTRWVPEAPRSAAVASELTSLLNAPAGSRLPLADTVIWRERDVLSFLPRKEPASGAATFLPGQSATMNGWRVACEEVRGDAVPLDRSGHQTEFVDLDALTLPLTVRPWRDGDRMRPLGLGGSRLVSDLLTDRHVPSSRRRDVLVVEDRTSIVWLVGHRIDNRVRLTEQTVRIAKLSYNLIP